MVKVVRLKAGCRPRACHSLHKKLLKEKIPRVSVNCGEWCWESIQHRLKCCCWIYSIISKTSWTRELKNKYISGMQSAVNTRIEMFSFERWKTNHKIILTNCRRYAPNRERKVYRVNLFKNAGERELRRKHCKHVMKDEGWEAHKKGLVGGWGWRDSLPPPNVVDTIWKQY